MLDRQQLTAMRAIHRQLCADFGFSSLLAKPEANPKIAKNMKSGIMTAPLHLAPYNLSGYQVCPKATAGCAVACLHTAGNPVAMAGKQRARIARTRAYFTRRGEFMIALAFEIATLRAKADRANMACGIRLNATSDIVWESVSFALPISALGQRVTLFDLFPEVSFYDYTKRANRRNIPSNYHLTFSLAENNEADAIAALSAGISVAVVFDAKKGAPLPEAIRVNGKRVAVIDGDESDYRPNDPRGVIVGLRAKGKAIGDRSGFVRNAALFKLTDRKPKRARNSDLQSRNV